MIHGASGTGHTLFVEPLETIDLNNDLVRLREEEQREVIRILRELTPCCARTLRHSSSGGNHRRAGIVVRQSPICRGFRLRHSALQSETSRRLILRDARHPVLEDLLRRQRKTVVPISLELDESTRHAADQRPQHGRQNRHP